MSTAARLQFLKRPRPPLFCSTSPRTHHALQRWKSTSATAARLQGMNSAAVAATTTTTKTTTMIDVPPKKKDTSPGYIASRKARKRTFWPKEAETIADGGQLLVKPFEGSKPPPAAIREVGNGRRVIMLQPYCQDAAQLKGLAYRIRALSTNTALHSVMLNLTEEDNPEGWPSYIMDIERPPVVDEYISVDWNGPKRLWSTGYDMQTMMNLITNTIPFRTKQDITEILTQLQQLGLAVHGDSQLTKIPFVSFCNGRIEDGGFALAMGSYVVATNSACLAIRNGFRGLSFDPLGYSFILPRLGWDYNQACADYPATGKILALTGFVADKNDMIETGLATHFMEGAVQDIMGYLEWALESIPPYDLQCVVPDPIISYGEKRIGDANAHMRNYALASTLYAATEYNASGYEMPSFMDYSVHDQMRMEDPSTDVDFIPCQQERYSELVDLASELDIIFQQETSVLGIMERLREVAATAKDDVDDGSLEQYLPVEQPLDVAGWAATMVENMEEQSPLSLCVMNRLLALGARPGENLERCMERELNAQVNMFLSPDFKTWTQQETKRKEEEKKEALAKKQRRGGRRSTTFETAPRANPKWQHASVKDVTFDQVEEMIFGDVKS